ncbi:MAG: shikimate dehydrogenase [Rhodospirillales bacterium]|nr:shikimate dehydrogenase [Rhodospirillales bacterium]
MVELRAGLIGANIQRTRLPIVLRALCDLNNIDFSFDLIDTALLDGFDFEACVNDRMQQGWTGVTVTHPYKTAAAQFAGAMSGAPAHMGASNTLIFNGAKTRSGVTAFNTDYTGFIAAWREAFGDRKPGRVAMAGAGGVARAVAVALVELGAGQLVIWDLQKQRAIDVAAVADPSGQRTMAIAADEAGPHVIAADGLVNATALGMLQYPGMAFEVAQIKSQSWAFDAVYTPLWTDFMKAAKANGLQCLTGFSLFKHMAVRTFMTYTGCAVDPADADRVIDPLIEGL